MGKEFPRARQTLIQAGHSVRALTRSAKGAEWLSHIEAEPHTGDINNLDRLRAGAENADAVIHLAFDHNFVNLVETAETDRRIIAALGQAMLGSCRPFIVTSGTAITAGSDAKTSELDPAPSCLLNPRAATEEAAAAVVERGGKVMVVRLSQIHDTAEAIGMRLALPVRPITAAQATAHIGWAAPFAAMNLPASSRITRAELGWVPSGPTMLEDLLKLELRSHTG